jgi:hypothetical protein
LFFGCNMLISPSYFSRRKPPHCLNALPLSGLGTYH